MIHDILTLWTRRLFIATDCQSAYGHTSNTSTLDFDTLMEALRAEWDVISLEYSNVSKPQKWSASWTTRCIHLYLPPKDLNRSSETHKPDSGGAQHHPRQILGTTGRV